MNRWLLLKDMLLTGAGVAVIFTQIVSSKPSDTLLVVGLALAGAQYLGPAKQIMSGLSGSHSPQAEQPESSQPSHSSSSAGGTGDDD